MRTILDAFDRRAAELGGRTAFLRYDAATGRAEPVLDWAGWHERSREFAGALAAAGHAPGETVAILAGNEPAWPVADLGTLLAGLVSVGVYPSSSPEQVREVLADAGAAVVVAHGGASLARLAAARAELPALRTVVVAPSAPVSSGAIGWDEWLTAGRGFLGGAAGAAELAARRERVAPDSTAILVYTSGSTGAPKGAILDHACLLASARSITEVLRLTGEDTAVSFLPYSHAGERIFGLATRILAGMTATLVADHAHVFDACRAASPTLFGGMPRFFEKVVEGLEAERASADPSDQEAWRVALALGRERLRNRAAGEPVAAEVERRWRQAADRLAPRVARWFGDRLRLATNGGAALPAAVGEYLDALGVTLLPAYGLTEHLCTAMHRPGRQDFTTVGPAMPGSELAIAEDGEVLVRRSPLSFRGYLGRPEETAAAFTGDGQWVRTGDLGALEPGGRLRITGRKKELIALAAGKKVAPLPIESRLVAEPWIAQAMLYGEGKKYVTALLTLRRPVVEAWARGAGLEMGWGELLRHPELLAGVQAAVDRVNAGLSRPEQVRRFTLLERELLAEEGELTPTQKLRRAVVADRHRGALEALYA